MISRHDRDRAYRRYIVAAMTITTVILVCLYLLGPG